MKGLTFFRPIGGGIEFGESGAEAIQREVFEELDLKISQVQFVGAFENIFTYRGEPGHEIVLVFDAVFKDARTYEQPYLVGRESNGDGFHARWQELSAFNERQPLFPEGLVKLVQSYWRTHAV